MMDLMINNCHLIWIYATSLTLIFLLNDVYIASLRMFLYFLVAVIYQHHNDVFAFVLSLVALVTGVLLLKITNIYCKETPLLLRRISVFDKEGIKTAGLLKFVLFIIYALILTMGDNIVTFTGYPVGSILSGIIVSVLHTVYILFVQEMLAHLVFIIALSSSFICLLIPATHSGWFVLYVIGNQLIVLFVFYSIIIYRTRT